MRIEGTTALVTGGASGLGLATTERLVAAGANVVTIDIPTSAGADVAQRLGESVRFVPGHVLDSDDVGEAVYTAAGTQKPFRIVVNCAGIGPPAKVVGKGGPHSLDLFKRIVEVNLIGTFNVIRLAAERIIELELEGEERGVIVNTASVAAFDG